MLFDMMEISLSGIAGKGYILRDELKQVRSLERRITEMVVDDYEQGMREYLLETITLANLLIFHGSIEARSEIASLARDALPDLDAGLTDSRERLELMSSIEFEADSKIRAISKILKDPKLTGVIAGLSTGTADLARLVSVREDLYSIRGSAGRAVHRLKTLVKMLEEDIAMLESYL